MSDQAVAPGTVQARVAQVQAARMSIADMPREAVRGYPVPVLHDGQLWLAFPFFLRRGLPPKPPEVSGFGWLVLIDVATGTHTVVRRLSTDLATMLGPHQVDPSLDMDAFLAAEARLYALMDMLLPLARQPGSVPPRLQPIAAEFRTLWLKLAHKPLAAQYHALNPAWFAMLGL